MKIDGVYYHPTFYYEFLWCILGFVILLLIRSVYKKRKDGQLTFIYLMWYSLGRFFIESLRTDSLMIKPFKVAQIVSVILFVVSFICFFIILFKKEQEEIVEEVKEIKKEDVKKVSTTKKATKKTVTKTKSSSNNKNSKSSKKTKAKSKK